MKAMTVFSSLYVLNLSLLLIRSKVIWAFEYTPIDHRHI